LIILFKKERIANGRDLLIVDFSVSRFTKHTEG
jgi:hypothetical protein